MLLGACAVQPPSVVTLMELGRERPVQGDSTTESMAPVFSANFAYVMGNIEGLKVHEKHSGAQMFNHLIGGLYGRDGRVVAGFAFQGLWPTIMAGFTSDYFGFLGWGAYVPTGDRDMPVYGGGSLVEQLPITHSFSIGITEHIARSYLSSSGLHRYDGYMEFGGGAYISCGGEQVTLALEFKYGRDVTNDDNHFTLLLNIGYGTFVTAFQKDSEMTSR